MFSARKPQHCVFIASCYYKTPAGYVITRPHSPHIIIIALIMPSPRQELTFWCHLCFSLVFSIRHHHTSGHADSFRPDGCISGRVEMLNPNVIKKTTQCC